jgi:serine/threonine protein kinase
MDPENFWNYSESDEFFHLYHSNINFNINNLYGWSFDENNLGNQTFIVLELMDGSLNELIWEGYHGKNEKEKNVKFKLLNDFEKVKILLDTAYGMSYLHNNNMIHRDLKSPNILFKYEKNYIAKLCDLGIAVKKESKNLNTNINVKTHIVRGTVLWLPVECIKTGAKNYSKMSDIYSFGIVMYELIDQKPPFSNNTESTKKNVKFSQIDLNDDYGIMDFRELLESGMTPTISKTLTETEKKLKEIMLKCLKVNPNERILLDKIIEELENLS